jgi:hypothetical protein
LKGEKIISALPICRLLTRPINKVNDKESGITGLAESIEQAAGNELKLAKTAKKPYCTESCDVSGWR